MIAVTFSTILGHSYLITCLTSFFGKKILPDSKKKKKKKVDFGVLQTKEVEKFSVRLQKIKKVQALKIFIVRTKYSE